MKFAARVASRCTARVLCVSIALKCHQVRWTEPLRGTNNVASSSVIETSEAGRHA